MHLSDRRLMEIGSVVGDNATMEESRELYRLVRIGQWHEDIFSLKFRDGNLPRPQDVLLGCRLRVQIDMPDGDWVDYRRDGRYSSG